MKNLNVQKSRSKVPLNAILKKRWMNFAVVRISDCNLENSSIIHNFLIISIVIYYFDYFCFSKIKNLFASKYHSNVHKTKENEWNVCGKITYFDASKITIEGLTNLLHILILFEIIWLEFEFTSMAWFRVNSWILRNLRKKIQKFKIGVRETLFSEGWI